MLRVKLWPKDKLKILSKGLKFTPKPKPNTTDILLDETQLDAVRLLI